MLKRGLRGLDDTPINQAHWAGLFYALDSRDWQWEEANKGRKSEGSSEKSKMHVLKTGLSAWLLRKSLSKDDSILTGFIITHQRESQTTTWTCRAYPGRVRTLWDWPGAFLKVYDRPGCCRCKARKGICLLLFLPKKGQLKIQLLQIWLWLKWHNDTLGVTN